MNKKKVVYTNNIGNSYHSLVKPLTRRKFNQDKKRVKKEQEKSSKKEALRALLPEYVSAPVFQTSAGICVARVRFQLLPEYVSRVRLDLLEALF